jgi:phosphate transport system substrate-binding protein
MYRFLNRPLVALGLALSVISCTAAAAETVAGAGAVSAIAGAGSQPLSRLYVLWGENYAARHGVPVSYKVTNVVQALQDLEGRKFDYAGTEIPQHADELKRKGQFQFPTALVAFTPVVNIPGIHSNELILDSATLAGIFLGTIKTWDDARIRALNPSLRLPDAGIKTVHRNTGNTITFALSSYLTQANPEWAAKVGEGSRINWPTGQEVDTNENLIAYVKDTPNAIGFTMLSLVIKNSLNRVRMKNREGNVVNATPDSIMAAASSARWDAADGFYNILINMPGAASWPVVMTGYVTIRVPQENPQTLKVLVDIFDNSLKAGQLQAVMSDLVPLPDSVASKIRPALKAQLSVQAATAVK